MRLTFSTEPVYTSEETRKIVEAYGTYQWARATFENAADDKLAETAPYLLHAIEQVRELVPRSFRGKFSPGRDEILLNLEEACKEVLLQKDSPPRLSLFQG